MLLKGNYFSLCTFSLFLIFLILIPFAEEILSQSAATWFSTDGSYLMYASFNTSQVGQVSFKIYGGDDPNNVFEDTPLYGDTMSLRYPKVSCDSLPVLTSKA